MKSKLIMFIALIGLTVMFSSCETRKSVLDAKIVSVIASIDSVKSIGGDAYIPEVYKALTDSLESTKAQIETEKSKWFPSHKKAVASLDLLKQTAFDALAKTEDRKTELKTKNDALITELKELLVTNTTLLKNAPKGKEGKEALDAIKSDLELSTISLTESESLIANGDILGANGKLNAIKDRLSSIKTELETAIAKVK